MKKKDTLSETMNALRDKGYTDDLNLLDDKIENRTKSKKYPIDEFEVDEYFRFEGMANPADNSILYAIKTSDGHKGMLVDGYGKSGGQVSEEMMNKLKIK
ncbi:phosphoribosylpyrophosphate synthetase [Psychroflexus sp. CAK8W]|uniref:Phosphoribosylpyrophosphate synthetase n=1 Tax=Psychroflexus longus TaxID=2873596 RepID=A0ABS7XLF3_9FLAO|nr:phosphoribosylpyrophosphate synthetase [Psychroflexus longus]MBZ9779298.1 phosphoribosylpyrophosphate synthetase [Psychroflexus longus]